MCIFAPCWRHVGESLLGEAILSGWHKATAFQYDLDCVQGLTSGILRGAGKQKIGAILNLVGYYGVGLPIGLSLMFAGKLGIVGMCHKRLQLWVHVQKSTKKKKSFVLPFKGLWSGIFVCVFLQATLFIAILWKLNWNKAAEEVSLSKREKKIWLFHLHQNDAKETHGCAWSLCASLNRQS